MPYRPKKKKIEKAATPLPLSKRLAKTAAWTTGTIALFNAPAVIEECCVTKPSRSGELIGEAVVWAQDAYEENFAKPFRAVPADPRDNGHYIYTGTGVMIASTATTVSYPIG